MVGSVPRLSELLERRASRRSFMVTASAATAALLASCRGSRALPKPPQGVVRAPNGDAGGPVAAAPPKPVNRATYRRFPPELPPVEPGAVKRVAFTVEDINFAVTPDLVVPVWTFNGSLPGPMLHVRQGDSVEFTLTNHGSTAHSMDFHAAQIDPKTAFRSIMPGQTTSYTFKPRYAGIFLYHCGTAPVLMHIGMGMFGAIVVDPPQPLPPAREFVLVENEFYVSTDATGQPGLDMRKMLETLPDHFAFNGHPFQYQQEPLRVSRGELVRFYVANAGPSEDCAFHVVGEQFDTVYLGAPPGSAQHGVQTFMVPAGGGMVFEVLADVSGEFVFVNHKFGHGQKGAIGVLVVEA